MSHEFSSKICDSGKLPIVDGDHNYDRLREEEKSDIHVAGEFMGDEKLPENLLIYLLD